MIYPVWQFTDDRTGLSDWQFLLLRTCFSFCSLKYENWTNIRNTSTIRVQQKYLPVHYPNGLSWKKVSLKRFLFTYFLHQIFDKFTRDFWTNEIIIIINVLTQFQRTNQRKRKHFCANDGVSSLSEAKNYPVIWYIDENTRNYILFVVIEKRWEHETYFP